MSTIVSDSSAIIDIDKACLLPALIGLPYHFVIPDALYEEELIELTNYSKSDLPKLGFHIEGFNSDGVEQAFAYQSRFPRLTPQDCFALTLASIAENTILLTGDKNLRKAAQQESIEVHGVIWACQQIHRYETASTQQIYQSLRWLEDDPTVWLPKRPLRAFLDYLIPFLKNNVFLRFPDFPSRGASRSAPTHALRPYKNAPTISCRVLRKWYKVSVKLSVNF